MQPQSGKLGGKMSEANQNQNRNGHFLPEAIESGAIWCGELDENEFVERYKPIKNHLDPHPSTKSSYGMFRTYGEDYEFVKGTNERHLWSYIDGESVTMILPGIVGGSDRMGLFITEAPWANQDEAVLLSVRVECSCFDQGLFDDGDEAGDPDCEKCEGLGAIWMDVEKSKSATTPTDSGPTVTTLFLAKAQILADIWLQFKDQNDFRDFIEYNDLALPLAYCFANSIITEQTATSTALIEEAFKLLLAGFELEDKGFQNLDGLLRAAGLLTDG
jgi:hypothetical protein